MVEGNPGGPGPEDEQQPTHIEDELAAIDKLSEPVQPKKTEFFQKIGEDLGLEKEEMEALEGKLSERPGFLVDLYAEQQYLAEHLSESIPSRGDLTRYQPEIEKWLADSERSPNRESKLHGPAHFMRVLINTKLLACLIEPQLPAKLSELSVQPVPEDRDYMVTGVNHEALAAFAIGHDWARYDDKSVDIRHGERAAESIDDTGIFPELDLESRRLAQALMAGHSQEDRVEDVAIEDRIARDSDLLDRHRDYEGPDPEYIRLQVTKRVDAVAFTLAVMSDFLVEKGEDQIEAVLKTAKALGVMKG